MKPIKKKGPGATGPVVDRGIVRRHFTPKKAAQISCPKCSNAHPARMKPSATRELVNFMAGKYPEVAERITTRPHVAFSCPMCGMRFLAGESLT